MRLSWGRILRISFPMGYEGSPMQGPTAARMDVRDAPSVSMALRVWGMMSKRSPRHPPWMAAMT